MAVTVLDSRLNSSSLSFRLQDQMIKGVVNTLDNRFDFDADFNEGMTLPKDL